MSSINFLPDDDKGRGKLEKKVRTIEYTRPEDSKKEKKSSHGGVLSMFKKSSNDFPKAAPAPVIPGKPGEKKFPNEPIVKSHSDVKKVEQKTVIAYRSPEVEKKEEEKKERKESFGWLKRFFSRSHKVKLAHESPAMPLPPKPSYAPGEMDEEKITTKDTSGVPLAMAEKKSTQADFTTSKDASGDSGDRVIQPANMPPPPPPFNPFKVESKPSNEPKVQEATQQASVVPPPPTPVGVVSAPPTPDGVQHEAAEPQMTEVQEEPSSRERGMSFDVNLVPDELVQRKRTMNRLTLLGVVVLVTAFVCVVVYGVLSYYKTNVSSNVVSVEETTARVQREIDLLTPVQRDALVLQKRTEEIQKLLDSQIHWIKLMDALETYTMKKVTLTKVSALSDGQVTIQGNAPDAAIAFEQIAVFRNATDFVQSLSITTTPSIPETATTTETVATGGLPFALPNEAPPGEVQTPKSIFAVQLQLTSEYLTSSDN